MRDGWKRGINANNNLKSTSLRDRLISAAIDRSLCCDNDTRGVGMNEEMSVSSADVCDVRNFV